MSQKRLDLARYVHERTEGYTLKEIQGMTDGLLEDILALAQDGRVVSLKNLGQLKQISKAARMGRNPKTKEEHLIPARKRLTFSFSPKLTHKEDDI